jgi:hypothetical protein
VTNRKGDVTEKPSEDKNREPAKGNDLFDQKAIDPLILIAFFADRATLYSLITRHPDFGGNVCVLPRTPFLERHTALSKPEAVNVVGGRGAQR